MCHWLGCACDRRLSLVRMPRQPRGSKRKRPPEEMPSSHTLEFSSHIRRGDSVVRKRTVEKMDFHAVDSLIVFPDDDVLPAPGSQSDPSTLADDIPGDASSDIASSSVSVSSSFTCHVIPAHASRGQDTGVDAVSPRIPLRTYAP